MATRLTIGDFSRISHLTVKTLRYYHRVGLLEPSAVDAGTGYRYYALDQVPTAQAIRRFRDLEMPVEQVRAVLDAPDATARDALIAGHLNRLQDQLEQTQRAVTSLRDLLEHPRAATDISRRSLPPTSALAIGAMVGPDDLSDWWIASFGALRSAAVSQRLSRTGPTGGLFADEVFQHERGEAVMFIPVNGLPRTETGAIGAVGPVRAFEVPGVDMLVAVHHGSPDDADRTYAALGSYAARHDLGAGGPMREYYVVGIEHTPDPSQWRTEICWPVNRPSR